MYLIKKCVKHTNPHIAQKKPKTNYYEQGKIRKAE
jgi:hypothetical protein